MPPTPSTNGPAKNLIVLVLVLTAVPTLSSALTLNPVERIMFGSRVESIRASVRSKFAAETLPNLFRDVSAAPCRDSVPIEAGDGTNGEITGGGGYEGADVVLIFPGAGGADTLTDELESCLRSWNAGIGSLDVPLLVATFDWSEHRGSIATAAFDGEAVGEACAEALIGDREGVGGGQMAEKLAEAVAVAGRPPLQPLKLRSVHSIGVSVGAFAANSFALTVRERSRRRATLSAISSSSSLSEAPHVRLTLLDPFTSRGLWGFSYGPQNFGRDVDFAEQVMNTDDPVPTTNEPLPLCFCVDVTGAEERERFNLPKGETMHCWPVAWYSRHGWRESREIIRDSDGKRRVGLPVHDVRTRRGSVLSK